jgi:flagellar hook-length control protein FliK
MLAEQGIDLGESNIEQQQQGQDEQESTNDNQKSGSLSSNENDEEIATVKVAGNKLGGVDFYA